MAASEETQVQPEESVDEFDLDVRILPGSSGGPQALANTGQATNCGTRCPECLDPDTQVRTCDQKTCSATCFTNCGSVRCKTELSCEGCASYDTNCRTCQNTHCKTCVGPCAG